VIMRDYLREHCVDEIVATDTFLNEWNYQLTRLNIRSQFRENEVMSIRDLSVMKYYTVYPKRQVIWK
jgi:hypothetical protein